MHRLAGFVAPTVRIANVLGVSSSQDFLYSSKFFSVFCNSGGEEVETPSPLFWGVVNGEGTPRLGRQ
jgi:hypothetical protein